MKKTFAVLSVNTEDPEQNTTFPTKFSRTEGETKPGAKPVEDS